MVKGALDLSMQLQYKRRREIQASRRLTLLRVPFPTAAATPGCRYSLTTGPSLRGSVLFGTTEGLMVFTGV